MPGNSCLLKTKNCMSFVRVVERAISFNKLHTDHPSRVIFLSCLYITKGNFEICPVT